MQLVDIFNKKFVAYLVFFIVLFSLPNFISSYQSILLQTGICFAIMALGFNLLLRYTGLLSFGHGALFAIGAYTVGMISEYLPYLYHIELLIPISLLVSLALAAVFGFICVRHTRIFFAIITLAFSMLIFTLIIKFYHLTGGTDGIPIELPTMLGKSFEGMKRSNFLAEYYYYVLISIFAICIAVMALIVSSPFGKTLQAVRDNEERAQMIGIRVKRYRWYAFLISGMFTGLSGALWSFVTGHITPDIANWVFSGEIVFMTLLGGFMVFEGPIVGALIFNYLRLYLTSMTEYWQLVLGIIFVLLVLLLPQGISGGFWTLLYKFKRKSYQQS